MRSHPEVGVSGPLTRQEALRLLGVPESAHATAVKQAYRRLVREHHPDLGGDPATFHRLQQAYERLSADDAPGPPAVSRGRPSRRPAPHTSEDAKTDLSTVDWTTPVPPGDSRLDRDRLAVALARGAGSTIHSVTATSRAPGSRLNGTAARLSPAFTSWLTVQPTTDDRGHDVVAIDLTGSGRRSRRALDRAELDGAWSRTRRTSSTSLRCTLAPSPDHRTTAVRVAGRVSHLLDGLGWPLGEWTLTVEGP